MVTEPTIYAFDVIDARVEALRKLSSALPSGTLLPIHAAVGEVVSKEVQINESSEGPTLGVGKPLVKVHATTIDQVRKDVINIIVWNYLFDCWLKVVQ